MPEKSRLVTTLHYLEGRSYQEIAEELSVPLTTIEGRLHRARKQLKQELLQMEDIDEEALESAIEKATSGLRDDIEEIKKQLAILRSEEDSWISDARRDAGRTITRLPTDVENPVTWGIVGGYRRGPEKDSRRISIWSNTDMSDYLGQATDEDIARFATLFTNPVTVGVLRHLVQGKRTETELVEGCGVPREEIESALEHLVESQLVARDDEGVTAHNKDTVTFLLTLVGLTILYHVQIGLRENA